MLKYIQKMLPYPPTGAVLVIYNILAEQNNLQKYVDVYKRQFKDPTAYLIRGTIIALRSEDTRKIIVTI